MNSRRTRRDWSDQTRTRLVVWSTVGVMSLIAAGCSWNRGERKDRETWRDVMALQERQAAAEGKLVAPKRCRLDVTFLVRPVDDSTLATAVWSAADEQVVDERVRRDLDANGIRIGVIRGDLPAEVESLAHQAKPDLVSPTSYDVPDGQSSLISLSGPASEVNLLLCREGRVSGHELRTASGWFRITATHDGARGVALRIVPETHHGSFRRGFQVAPSAAPLAPREFAVNEGQEEETYREMLVKLNVEPNQTVVVGRREDRERSLGSFLFTMAEPNSDRILQKVVLIRAERKTDTQVIAN